MRHLTALFSFFAVRGDDCRAPLRRLRESSVSDQGLQGAHHFPSQGPEKPVLRRPEEGQVEVRVPREVAEVRRLFFLFLFLFCFWLRLWLESSWVGFGFTLA